jgi:hypothetical protein
LARTLARGIGLYREAGLGRVWLNPPLLEDEQPGFEPPSADNRTSASVPDCKHPLIAWLRREVGVGDEQERLETLARRLSQSFEQQRRQAARWQGLPADAQFGPSRSQWGRVLECARTTPAERLPATLFAGDNAIVKPTAEGWSEHCLDPQGGQTTLAAWLQGELQQQPNATLARLVQRLAHLCRDALELDSPGAPS